MDEESLREFVERSQEIIEKTSQMDEANTKSKIIRPFIEEVLGWDFYNDVELEYSVKISTSRISKVDYALMKDNEPVVFIEAKGCDTNVSDDDTQQLASYMKQRDVNWGLITNGEYYEILQRDILESGKVEVNKLISFKLDNLKSNMYHLSLLSKESLKRGDSEKIANKIRQRKRAINKLENDKEIFTDEIIRIISTKIGEEFTQNIENQSKNFIDNLIEEIEKPFRDGSEKEPIKISERRASLSELPNGEVVVCPSNPGGIENGIRSGVEFLKYHNAWGFIRINEEPKYLAMYVTKPVQEVKYFGEIEKIIDPGKEESPIDNLEKHNYSEGYKLILLKEGSLRELENPILFGEDIIQNLRYTDLEKLKKASTTDDLWD